MVFSPTATSGAVGQQLLSDLQFFFFNPAGVSPLEIETSHNDGVSTFNECVGFSAQLSVTCAGNFPTGVRGVIKSSILTVFTTQLPTLQLLSRREIPDPDPTDPTPVPEPGTLLLLGTGVSALVVRTRRKAD